MVSQGHIFESGEGDRWFERNRASLDQFDPATDVVMRVVEDAQLSPRSAAELGAANGVRIAAIAARYGCRAVAVDVSPMAVDEGRRKFHDVEFHVAPMDRLPLDESFELIVVNFVLHWIERPLLMRTVSEIDRVLADGGHLVIGDFLPDGPTRTPYHHLPDQVVWTYKQDYAAVFLSSGLYRLVLSMAGTHQGHLPTGDVPEQDRVGTWLLRKGLDDYYSHRELT
jgi:ubiquinone/menaquinone biosynthesis C-methylase UbiE